MSDCPHTIVDADEAWADGLCPYCLRSEIARLKELHVMQLAGISTAAQGYHKASDSIHPDYKTVALDDVMELYAKYDALFQITAT